MLAFLRDEPAAPSVRELLEREHCRLTAVGVAEVVDRLVRLAGIDEDEAILDLAQLGLLDGKPVDSGIGAAAGRLRARRYHRTWCAVSMADAIAAETARAEDAALVTADPHLLTLCHLENIAVIALAGTDGSMWSAPS